MSICFRYHQDISSVDNSEIQVPEEIGNHPGSIQYDTIAAQISWTWLFLSMSRLFVFELEKFGGTTSNYIDFPSYGPLNQNGTISVWVKGSKAQNGLIIGSYNSLALGFYGSKVMGSTSGLGSKPQGIISNYDDNGWNHVVVTMNNGTISYYINGVKLTNTSSDYWGWTNNGTGRVGMKNSSSNMRPFNGQIDEVRVYNRALSLDEIQFLYKSNLSKTDISEWIFQTLNTCLAQTGNYIYSGIVKSRYGYSDSTGRGISTCIPGVSLTGGVDMHLGTGTAGETVQEFSGQYPVNIEVEDWIGRNGWIGSVRISDSFLGQNTNLTFSSTGFEMKNDMIQDLGHFMLGIVPEYATGLVKLSNILSDYQNIITYAGENQGTPYFVPDYPDNDFMCNGGMYGDKPYLKVEVPAWTPGDTYVATIYWTIEP